MFYSSFVDIRKHKMAIFSIKALSAWIHNFILMFLLYAVDFQKMVTVPDFEYLRNKGVFMLFCTYFLSTVVLHIFKIISARLDIKIKNETLKAKEEIRKYIENKNKIKQ